MFVDYFIEFAFLSVAFALLVLSWQISKLGKIIDKPHPLFDNPRYDDTYVKEEIENDAELDDILETGVYRVTPEDMATYYNERALEDRVAQYDPYDNEELQEMLKNG